MTRNLLTILAVIGLLAATAVVARAQQRLSLPAEDLADFVREADLIIEGEVGHITGEVAKTVPNYVGQGRHQIMLDFGTVAAIDFEVEKTFKGLPREGAIRIYAKPDFTGSFNTLMPNRKYVLFLKKHRFKKGYEVMDNGRLEWTVFDYEGTRKVKAWSQLPQYRPSENYMDYTDLIRQIAAHLSQAETPADQN